MQNGGNPKAIMFHSNHDSLIFLHSCFIEHLVGEQSGVLDGGRRALDMAWM